MDQWVGKVAVITGAGGTIATKICEDLVKAGMIVIGLEKDSSRHNLLVENTKLYIEKKYTGQLVPYMCDISNDEELRVKFKIITSNYHHVDVLINNAVVAKDGLISTGNFEDFKNILNTNLFGLVTCTKLAIDIMRKNNRMGHIINLNSICGHYMPPFNEPRLNLYVATKCAMTSITETLRQEFRYLKANIKVTSISPGVVQSEVFERMDCPVFNNDFLQSNPTLRAEDVSNIVLMVLSTPPHVQIHEIIVHALHEVY